MPCRQQCTSGVVQCQGTDCILLSGTGVLGDPLEASPVIDPDPTNALSCGPTGLFVPPVACPPDLFADGGVPAGSLPIVTGVNFGGNPLLPNGCGPLMDAYGPQADVLLTNTTTCSFAVEAAISPTRGYFSLDPGASLSVGWVVQVTGINLPPAPIVFPGAFYSGVNENNPAPSVVVCGVNADSVEIIPPTVLLAPGDFVWISLIAVLYITGAGPSTTFSPAAGTGPQVHLRGQRL